MSREEARAFVDLHHRHAEPPVSWKFGAGLERDSQLVGVAIAGRPVARLLDDGYTIEITRVATDGTRNACSMLYGAVCRAAKALGYRRAVTYTLETEAGASPKAAGFALDARIAPRDGWSTPARRRADDTLFGSRRATTATGKRRWIRAL